MGEVSDHHPISGEVSGVLQFSAERGVEGPSPTPPAPGGALHGRFHLSGRNWPFVRAPSPRALDPRGTSPRKGANPTGEE